MVLSHNFQDVYVINYNILTKVSMSNPYLYISHSGILVYFIWHTTFSYTERSNQGHYEFMGLFTIDPVLLDNEAIRPRGLLFDVMLHFWRTFDIMFSGIPFDVVMNVCVTDITQIKRN